MEITTDLECLDLMLHFQFQKLFLEVLREKYLPGQEISMTTYREGDKADTGHRDLLKSLGFAERELLTEDGYPTQRFVFLPSNKEGAE